MMTTKHTHRGMHPHRLRCPDYAILGAGGLPAQGNAVRAANLLADHGTHARTPLAQHETSDANCICLRASRLARLHNPVLEKQRSEMEALFDACTAPAS